MKKTEDFEPLNSCTPVYICARCGRRFPHRTDLFTIAVGTHEPGHHYYKKVEDYELCSECKQELINWINHNENVEKTPSLEEIARSLFGALPEEDNET